MSAHTDAAATPDGDDTLRGELIAILIEQTPTAVYGDGTIKIVADPVADALMPTIREHTTAAVVAERERIGALLAAVPDEYYPTDVFGGPLSTDESRQANELLQAEGLPTYDRVGANAMRHAYATAASIAREEPTDDR